MADEKDFDPSAPGSLGEATSRQKEARRADNDVAEAQAAEDRVEAARNIWKKNNQTAAQKQQQTLEERFKAKDPPPVLPSDAGVMQRCVREKRIFYK